MKKYRVTISPRAKRQIREYIRYILKEKKNPQAAGALADDFEETLEKLSDLAGSLRVCDDADLAKEGIREILFQRHDYLMLYETDADEAKIHGIYHALQDYENLFRDGK